MQSDFLLAIEPNVGLGPLRFGGSFEEVRDRLGAPDRVDRDSAYMGLAEGWYYDKWELDVFFHSGELTTETWVPGTPLRVILFTSSSRHLTLWGEAIIGQSEPELLDLFRDQGHCSLANIPNSAGLALANNLRGLRCTDLNLDLHFDGKLLRQVQWGVSIQESPYGYCFPT